MENFRNQYPIKFIDELKPNFIGLPTDLASCLANLAYKGLSEKLVYPLTERSTEAEKYRHNEALRTFINCSLFNIVNLRVTQNFRAYIVEHGHVEISAYHRENLTEETVEIRSSSSQHDLDRRWFTVKTFIDESNLSTLVLSIFDRQNQRDKEILFKKYGICGLQESGVSDLADEYNLSRARVYQILNLFEQNNRKRMRRKASIIRSGSDQRTSNADGGHGFRINSDVGDGADFIDWINRLGNVLLDNQVSFASATDYLSLKFPDEFNALRKIVPILRDAESFFNFVSNMSSRLMQKRKVDFDRPILSNDSLIEGMKDIDIATLPLPLRTINVLKATNIHTADQLAQLTLDDLYQMPNLGRSSINSIIAFFSDL